MPSLFEAYLEQIRETPIAEQTEHTSRAALEDLLRRFASAGAPRDATVQHEPKRERDKGAPDFKIKRRGMILGYVEVKEIGANLDKALKSDQIRRYRELSDNILLTDYLQWIWIDRERVKGREILAYPTDLEGRTIKLRPDRADAVGKLIAAFFSEPPQSIGRAQQLALELATRARLLRDFLTVELARQQVEHREGRLFALYEVFRTQVFHELTTQEFADAFAQMLAYGLFLARLNAGANEIVTLDNVRAHIPGSFRLVRELVRFIEEMNEREYDDARWIVEQVLSIVNGLDLAAIHEDLSFRHRRAISRKVRAGDEEEHRLFEKDPFIYFYEDFLRAYDPKMSKGRGVYYTPPPIVNFIIRAVDDLLKDAFGIRDGLADHKRVTVLDFACGTGTFLLEVFERIFDNIGGPDSAKAAPAVREHILKNVFGFEYLIAPYTIAHLKLSQYLKDKGHELHDDERLQVFLTNTLEPIEPQKNFLLPAIAAEVEAAQKVKEKPILVITGNPPYSGHSKNKGLWIATQIAKYREEFPELSKPAQGKWLQDDYVKFIRFAQMKMDGGDFECVDNQGDVQTVRLQGVDQGIVGVITNHSYLDNPTFKGMRKSLMETFDQIYVLDLHGNSKKKEHAPDGGEDQNVFDIEQGVAIGLFVKGAGLKGGVWHGDLWGKQLEKYQAAVTSNRSSIPWTQLGPAAPDWLFKPQDVQLGKLYREFWSIPAIFAPLGDPAPGIVTTQDEFAISFSAAESRNKVRALLATRDETEARQLFQLCSQSQWSYARAKEELPRLNLEESTVKLTYRPFDDRWTLWDRNVAVHRRDRVMRHMLKSNIGLIFVRQIAHSTQDISAYALVTSEIIDNRVFLSNKGIAYLAPIYLADDVENPENISPSFRSSIDGRYGYHYSPDEILGYIYAVLHAPIYRARYAEFLRTDFPRIPFPETRDAFEALSRFGAALVNAHLLREVPRRGLADYHGRGDNIVEFVRYAPQQGSIEINKTQCFAPMPQPVWDFHIGGYQVLDKYLKSRKGRVLSLDEITHVGAVADALAFTIEQMAKIDQAYLAAFPDRG
jgi:hypothetical protein